MSQSSEKNYLEPIGIFFALVIIFLIWLQYPVWIEWKDEPLLQKEKTEIQTKQAPMLTFDALFKQESAFIPYKLAETQTVPVTPTEAEPNSTQLQALGEKYGTFGDTYGALNTLFSGLAFAILIITMLMQRQELKAQREELAEQRNELIAQRKEAEQGNKIAEGQRVITEQQATLIKQQIDEARVQNFYMIFFKQIDNLNQRIKANIRSQNDFFNSHVYYFIEKINELCLCNSLKEHKKLYFQQMLAEDYEHKKNFLVCEDLNESQIVENILLILNFIKSNSIILKNNQTINILLSYIHINLLLALIWLAIIENEQLKKYFEEFSMLKQISGHVSAEQLEFLKLFIDEKAFQEPV